MEFLTENSFSKVYLGYVRYRPVIILIFSLLTSFGIRSYTNAQQNKADALAWLQRQVSAICNREARCMEKHIKFFPLCHNEVSNFFTGEVDTQRLISCTTKNMETIGRMELVFSCPENADKNSLCAQLSPETRETLRKIGNQ
jgi:hypothetical protein